MNTHADIFFTISSAGFVVVTILIIIALVYVISILRKVKYISEKIGDNVQDISTDAKEFVRDVRDSGVYRMLFAKKRKSK